MAHEDPELRARIGALEDHELARMLTVDSENYRDEALALGREEAGRRMLDVATAAREGPPSSSTAPRSKPPPSLKFVQPFPIRELRGFQWAAGLFAISVAVELFGTRLAEPDSEQYRAIFLMVFLAGLIEYMRIVFRMHRALQIATDGAYPVTPWFAVVGHFLPFYNVYWLHAWSARVIRCAAKNGRVAPGAQLLPTVVFLLGLMPGFHTLSVRVGLFFAAARIAQEALVRAVRDRPVVGKA